MKRYGVLIASSQFPEEPKLMGLRCPENDVDGLNDILVSKDHGEFTDIFVLKNNTHFEVLRILNRVLRQADRNDFVLIYYSGHGKLNLAGRLHLATVDTVINELESTSIPVETIRNYVDISSSNQIVLLLDCCFSGAVDGVFARGCFDDQLQLISGGRGTYIMTASTGIQVAIEKEGDKYGVFTKHIIEGIRSGKADLDGDGRVSMAELYRYVHDHVLEEGAQEPMKWELNVRGELFIARSGKTAEKGPEPKSQLFVDTVPKDAIIVIPNSDDKFVQGMNLKPGTYYVEVSAKDYKTAKELIKLDIGEVKHVVIRLKEEKSIPNGLMSRQELILWSLWVLTISIGWFISWCLNHYFIVPLTDSAVMVGLMQGLFIGFPQYFLLRKQKIQVNSWLLALLWIGATTVGIIINSIYDVAWDNSKFYNWALWGAILGTFQVFVLYFLLTPKIYWAALWVLISALGTGLGSLWLGRSPLWPFTNILVGAVYGVITGFGWILLLRQGNYEN